MPRDGPSTGTPGPEPGSPGDATPDPGDPGAGESRTTDGRRTRWDAHRVERRAQLVDAALLVLGEVGPEFGLDQVAEQAGVTKPVIYRHFADRAGLVQAMGERATAILLDERVLPVLQRDDTPRARIRHSVDAFLGFLGDHPNIYWLFVRHGVADGNDVAQTNKELIAAAVAAVLSELLRAGMADTGVAEVWAHGLVGFVQNTAEWWLERRTMSRDALAEYVTVLIWAQFSGLAREHGLEVDADAPFGPEDVARWAQGGGSAAG